MTLQIALIFTGIFTLSIVINILLFKNRTRLKEEISETVDAYEKELCTNDAEIVALNKHIQTLTKYAESNKKIKKETNVFIKEVLHNEELTEPEKDSAVADLLASDNY